MILIIYIYTWKVNKTKHEKTKQNKKLNENNNDNKNAVISSILTQVPSLVVCIFLNIVKTFSYLLTHRNTCIYIDI